MRIDAEGRVLVTSPTGLGYGTGAGGTVTQATSKSTAVTLNKPCGQITMHAASLAAGASVTLTFNNTLLSSNDSLLLTIDGTSMTVDHASYRLASTVLDGSSRITLTNIAASARAEAVRINFAIIKGASS